MELSNENVNRHDMRQCQTICNPLTEPNLGEPQKRLLNDVFTNLRIIGQKIGKGECLYTYSAKKTASKQKKSGPVPKQEQLK